MAFPGIFITATDTGVGKTWLACRLLEQLAVKQVPLRVYKPVESGCIQRDGCLLAQDAELLLRAGNTAQTLDQVCKYKLPAAVSPARAASLENIEIKIAELSELCKQSTEWFSLVEGAGGVYSPLTQDGLNADLAEQLKLQLLVVCPNRLGCISQCLLVLEAARRRNLAVLAVVLNQLPSDRAQDKHDESIAGNAQELAALSKAPVLTLGANQHTDAKTLAWLTRAVCNSFT